MKNLKFVPVGNRHLKRLNEIVNNREVSSFLTTVPPVSMRSTVAWYKQIKAAKSHWWALVYRGEVVGSVSLMRKGVSPKLKHIVEVGLAIDRPYWGMDFGKAAILFAKQQAKKTGFKRFELYVVRKNRRALKLYQKCGFKKEGVAKGFMKIGRKYCDAVMMSIWLG